MTWNDLLKHIKKIPESERGREAFIMSETFDGLYNVKNFKKIEEDIIFDDEGSFTTEDLLRYMSQEEIDELIDKSIDHIDKGNYLIYI